MGKRKREEKHVEEERKVSSDEDEEEDEEPLIPLEQLAGSKKKKDDADEVVEVDFNFVDPKEVHFHSVKTLLRHYFHNDKTLDFSGLASLILDQVEVGTILQLNEEEDAYAFITALPLDAYRGKHPCIDELVNRLLKLAKGKDKEAFAQLKATLESKGTGLLLHHRMVNLPPQIAVPLQDALRQDIEWILSKERGTDSKTKALQEHMKFKQLVLVAPCDVSVLEADSKPKKKKKSKKDTPSSSEIFYHRFDDEIYASLASNIVTVELPLTPTDIAKGVNAQHRALITLPGDCLPQAVTMIEQFLGASA